MNNEMQHLLYQEFISHYCRPSEKYNYASRPSRINAASFEEVECLLITYVDKFTDLDVTPS